MNREQIRENFRKQAVPACMQELRQELERRWRQGKEAWRQEAVQMLDLQFHEIAFHQANGSKGAIAMVTYSVLRTSLIPGERWTKEQRNESGPGASDRKESVQGFDFGPSGEKEALRGFGLGQGGKMEQAGKLDLQQDSGWKQGRGLVHAHEAVQSQNQVENEATERMLYLVEATDERWLLDRAPIRHIYEASWLLPALTAFRERLSREAGKRSYQGAIDANELEHACQLAVPLLNAYVVALLREAFQEACVLESFGRLERADSFEARVGEYRDQSESIYRVEQTTAISDKLRAWLEEKEEQGYAYQAFDGALLDEGDYDGLDMRYTAFRSCSLKGSSIQKAVLAGSRWENCALDGCHFIGSRLYGASFAGCALAGSRFAAVDADAGVTALPWGPPPTEGLRFERCNLSGAAFPYARLRGAIFRDSRLAEVSFFGAELEGACFAGSDLRGADFTGAQITGADFRGAQLDDGALLRAFVRRSGPLPLVGEQTEEEIRSVAAADHRVELQGDDATPVQQGLYATTAVTVPSAYAGRMRSPGLMRLEELPYTAGAASYFKLMADTRAKETLQVPELGKVYGELLRGGLARGAALPEQGEPLHVAIQAQAAVVYPDLIEHPVPLVSDRLKRVLEMYVPAADWQLVVLADVARCRQELYWVPLLQVIAGAGEGTEWHRDGTVRQLVLNSSQVTSAVFRVQEMHSLAIYVELAVAESILRRGMTGIRLEPVMSGEPRDTRLLHNEAEEVEKEKEMEMEMEPGH
ncbi:pentapeptide repeat-containing protein [Paenibacillus sp. SYP-B4298]|uniref:pentapeptide repeat-containing protein n=1 Tax=Paenibacillus sp. SYP-B4298 TaxID=2996034 RepID=UPI0022DE0650|nr:pentapeptide repeat-containing protein [Paenibacillus sp. SYP-B4298]